MGKEGHKLHFWKSLSHKKTKSCIVSSLQMLKETKTWEKKGGDPVAKILIF